jgi:hypothetical protein
VGSVVLLLLFCVSTTLLPAQQLVVLSRDHVVLRLRVGDLFQFQLKEQRRFQKDRIVELTESEIITTNDTLSHLAFQKFKVAHKAEKSFQLRSSADKIIIAGILLPIGEYITITAVQDLEYEPNPGVLLTSGALITTGLLLKVISRPIIRINRNQRIRVVNYGSVFYQ